jgi:hypothetical protein
MFGRPQKLGTMPTASQLLAVGLDAVKDTRIALEELIELEDTEEDLDEIDRQLYRQLANEVAEILRRLNEMGAAVEANVIRAAIRKNIVGTLKQRKEESERNYQRLKALLSKTEN